MFLFHWKEESQHAILDELEWRREDAKLDVGEARDAAVDDLIALVGARRRHPAGRRRRPTPTTSCAWPAWRADEKRAVQVRDGAEGLPLAVHRLRRLHPRFQKMLASLVSPGQMERIQAGARAVDVRDAGAGGGGCGDGALRVVCAGERRRPQAGRARGMAAGARRKKGAPGRPPVDSGRPRFDYHRQASNVLRFPRKENLP